MKKPRTQTSFFILTIALILLAGILIVISIPKITAYRYSIVDRLLTQSQDTNESLFQLSLLEQAHLIGGGDSKATDVLAQFWLTRGEIKRAIDVYETSSNPDYPKLGSLALSAQNYPLALNLFQKASKKQASADTLTGEAIAFFNQEKVAEGCAKAAQASKLSLQSQSAKNAAIVCQILGGTQTEIISLVGQKPAMSDRESAYFLINNQVYKIGESKLQSVESKTVTDWLVLSRLASAHGDIKLAISSAEEGIGLDRSNTEMNKQLVSLYRLSGDFGRANEYLQRLQQLEIDKYQ